MPPVLLPASAAAFAPRSPPNVVLSRVEPWLTAALRRVNRVRRPLNNVNQHTRCLTDLLAEPTALWTLCSVMLPRAREAELVRDENRLVEAMFNYQLLQIEAYVVHIDMVSQNEVAFKLTADSIASLVDYHRDVYCADSAVNTWAWPGKDAQLRKLRDDFIQAANRFVYRTSAPVLEGLDEGGAGELLADRAADAKQAVLGLFVPLLPPPPRIIDVVRPTPLLMDPSPPPPPQQGLAPEAWWQQLPASTTPAQPAPQQSPIDPWGMLPASPESMSAPPDALGNNDNNTWAAVSTTLGDTQLPSPASSPDSSYSNSFCDSPPMYSTPLYYSPPAPISTMPMMMPSMLVGAQQCGPTANLRGFWSDDTFGPGSSLSLPYGTAI